MHSAMLCYDPQGATYPVSLALPEASEHSLLLHVRAMPRQRQVFNLLRDDPERFLARYLTFQGS